MSGTDYVLGFFFNFFTLSAVVEDARNDDQRKENESADANDYVKGIATLVGGKNFGQKGFFLLH